MSRIRARRRSMAAAVVSVAVALFCLSAGSAWAGTYDITSCNPDGTAAGWAPFGGPAYQSAIVCPYNGDLTSRGLGVANRPNSGVIEASIAGLMFQAPPGTSLVGIGTGIRVSRWDQSYWASLMTASGVKLYGLAPNDGAPVGSYSPQSWFPMNREGNVRLVVGCGSLCDTASLVGSGFRAWAQIFDPITIRIEDDDAPAETLTGGGLLANPYATGTQTVAYGATDASGIRTARLYVDGSKLRDDARSCNFEQPVPCSNASNASYSLDTRSLGDGSHTVKVETVDSAGNSASQSRSIVVDNTAPTAPSVNVAGGDAWRGSNNFTASWVNPSGQTAPIVKARYQLCGADDSSACQPVGTQTGTNISSINGLSVPAEGDYTLSVWLEDAAGNASAANASAPVHLRYDASAPAQVRNLSVTGGDVWSARNSFDLSWEDPAGQLAPITNVHYRLCDAAGACTTESRTAAAGATTLAAVSVPGPGDYLLTLWVGDAAGNGSEASASAAVHLKFDDTDPGRADVRPVTGWLNAADVADGYDVPVSLDPSNPAPPSGLAGFAVSTDGSEPATTPDIGPDGSLHVSDVPEGRMTVKARAISNSGVASSRVGSAVLLVDKTAPIASASDAPDPDKWQPRSVTLTLAGSDQLSGMSGGHVSYSVDGGPVETVLGDSASVTVADDGEHTITYRATDLAGNSSAQRSMSFKLDTTPPGDAALSDPGRWLNAADPAHYVQKVGLVDGARAPLSGIAGYSITTDGESPDSVIETSGDSVDLGRLEEGTTVIRARAVSGSGLASSHVAGVDVRVDRTAPDVLLIGEPDAESWQGRAMHLDLKGTDALSGMSDGHLAYRLDDGDETTVRGGSASVEVDLDGTHTIRYYAVDAAGNRSGVKVTSFKLDSAKPGAAVVDSSDGWITAAGAYVEHLALGDGEALPPSGLAGFSVTTDGSTPDDTAETDAGGSYSIADLPEGVTTVKARAISGAGIGSEAVGVGTIKVDRTSPTAFLDRPEGDSLGAHVSDATSGVRSGLLEMRAAGTGTWTPLDTLLRDGRLTAAVDVERIVPGTYDLRATAIDAAGNRRMVTTFASGEPATVELRGSEHGSTSGEPPAVAPSAPQTGAPKAAPVRCRATSKHARRVHRHRKRGKRHQRARKRHANHTCRKGGEKHQRRHLTRETHKPARRTAG